MAFTVTWVRNGRPEVFGEEWKYEIAAGVLNISAADGRLLEEFSPQAWFSVQPFAVQVDPLQPGPGLNWAAVRQQGYGRP